MRSLTTATLIALLAAHAAPARAAEIVPIEWGTTGSFERELTLPAGKFAEVCGKLAAASSVAWSFEADAPTDFNVHYHEGEKVSTPAKLDRATRAAATLRVDAQRDYCWMWTNKTGQVVRLKLRLSQGR